MFIIILFSLIVGGVFVVLMGLYIQSIFAADAAKRHRNQLKLTLANQVRRATYRKNRLKKIAGRSPGVPQVLVDGTARRPAGSRVQTGSVSSATNQRGSPFKDQNVPTMNHWRHSNSSRDPSYKNVD